MAIYLRQHDDTSVAQKTAFSRLAHRLTSYTTLHCMLRWCCTLFTTTGKARSFDSLDLPTPFEKESKMRATLVLLRLGLFTVLLVGLSVQIPSAQGQALTMDGQSGVFFQPWANVVPSAPKKWNGPTLGYHAVTAGPVAGDYFNASVEVKDSEIGSSSASRAAITQTAATRR